MKSSEQNTGAEGDLTLNTKKRGRAARRELNKTSEEGEGLVVDAPKILSFRDFLVEHARVPGPGGEYRKYSFEGREPLIAIVELMDDVLGSAGRPVQPDATIAICGGAQFGKSATELNLGAY
ncbi:MAG TPA: hypothetical protein VN516_06855, partial [Candidatus Baltobacteraceae bacterium]|nr:hypothetical protein [Candidatus Baltobacteraceae bacterium]